jgi:DNA-binding beta-propeller fold protein YncE
MMARRIISTAKGSANAWDLSAAAFDLVVSVSAQSSGPQNIWLKDDGAKMYITSPSSAKIYPYTLPTPFVLTGATYDGAAFAISEDAAPRGTYIRADGIKMYVIGISNNRVFQYTLSTPWDVTTATYDSVSFSYAAENTWAHGLFFKEDGEKMYVVGFNNAEIYQYTLATAWNVSTATYDGVSLDVSTQGSAPTGIFIKPDGTKLYALDQGSPESIFQYALSPPWDLTGAAYDSIAFDISGQEASPNGLFFRDTGTRFFVTGAAGDDVNQYSMVA